MNCEDEEPLNEANCSKKFSLRRSDNARYSNWWFWDLDALFDDEDVVNQYNCQADPFTGTTPKTITVPSECSGNDNADYLTYSVTVSGGTGISTEITPIDEADIYLEYKRDNPKDSDYDNVDADDFWRHYTYVRPRLLNIYNDGNALLERTVTVTATDTSGLTATITIEVEVGYFGGI